MDLVTFKHSSIFITAWIYPVTTKIILPGVGAFDFAMTALQESGMKNQLDHLVLEKKLPVLGICVGMHLLAQSSEEGSLTGLSWVDADVKKFDFSSLDRKTNVPHMGWNSLKIKNVDALLDRVDLEFGYYFLHSYYFSNQNAQDALTSTSHGHEFTSSIRSKNIYGVQFHPEKSHQNGIQLLKNFAAL
jgi:imidazole glycerol-phosphate synthase subunit HisH